MSAQSPQEAAVPAPRWTVQTPLADLQDTEAYAAALAEHLRAGDLLVLTGGLGAGKTTFTQSLAAALGVSGQVSSPTFVLSRIHRSTVGGPDLVHVDAYRTDAAGLESLDLISTLTGSVTVVEWGRGLVERALLGEAGSWLELELRRTEAEVPEASEPAESDDGAIITDFSETEADVLGSSRLAVLHGHGPRWDAAPL